MIMKNLKVMLWFDVEDFITPEADDALLALLNMLNGIGIRASWKLVGDKIRVLKERGRKDILDLIAGHEVCYHTNYHSVHPTPTEYESDRGFADGAELFESREKQGFLDVQEITGQFPYSYGQPGESWVPQAFPVLRKWGIPTYLDYHCLVTLDEKAFRYGDVLNLTWLRGMMRVNFHDGGMKQAKEHWNKIIRNAEDGDGVELVSIYYHPCEFACEDFWDGVNFMHGVNPPRDQWQPSPLLTPEERVRRVKKLEEFLRWTLETTDAGVEYITASESCRYEKTAVKPITGADIREMACALTKGPDYFVFAGENRSLCASEILSLFARETLGLHRIPEFFYGPEDDVPSVITESASPRALADAFVKQYDRVLGSKQLPVLYRVGENQINPIDLFENLRRALAEGIDPDTPMTLSAGGVTLTTERHIYKGFNWVANWEIFPDDLDTSLVEKHATLQTWTLKPALF